MLGFDYVNRSVRHPATSTDPLKISFVYSLVWKFTKKRYYYSNITNDCKQYSVSNKAYTYITAEVIDLSGLDDVIGVGQAGPVVKVGSVVGIIDLDLALLGQLKREQVRWEVELSLGFVKIFLVEKITSNLAGVQSQHDQGIIVDAEGSNVVPLLLPVSNFVLVLWGFNT